MVEGLSFAWLGFLYLKYGGGFIMCLDGLGLLYLEYGGGLIVCLDVADHKGGLDVLLTDGALGVITTGLHLNIAYIYNQRTCQVVSGTNKENARL